MESIKAKSQVVASTDSAWAPPTGGTHVWDKPMVKHEDTAKVSADVQSAKLKQMLGKIKTG
jgi:hypothetical protein